jgi:HAD superfamily hydrolase (TIGR01509 family)
LLKGLIFDCFGVLITSALDGACAEFAPHDMAKRAEVWNLIHASSHGLMDNDEVSRRSAEILGISTEAFVQSIARREVKNSRLMSQIMVWRKAGYKTALLSNVSAHGLDRRFTVSELAVHFDVVVPSGSVCMAKPDPGIYRLVCDQLGLDPTECMMIDDNPDYIEGAKAISMQGIVYTGQQLDF